MLHFVSEWLKTVIQESITGLQRKFFFLTDMEQQKWKIIDIIFQVCVDLNLFQLMSKWLHGLRCIWAKFIRKVPCSFGPWRFIIVFTKPLEHLLRHLNQTRDILYGIYIILYLYSYVLKFSLSSGLPTTICKHFLTHTDVRDQPLLPQQHSVKSIHDKILQ